MKTKKGKPPKIDGLSPEDIEKIRKAIRQVWNWSYPRKLAKQRCLDKNGFFVCEQCNKITPKIQIHHIKQVGNVDEGFIERLFCPSKDLIALCPSCHRKITNEERKHNTKNI